MNDAEIIELHEALEITELSPVEHKYAGKRIEPTTASRHTRQ